MGFDWAEKFSEGRKIRQRVPVLGYRVPLLSNLQVKIKGFSVAVKNVTNRNILCGNVPTVLVSIVYHMSGEMISVLSLWLLKMLPTEIYCVAMYQLCL
jgi:type IV secretory pathway TrbD component